VSAGYGQTSASHSIFLGTNAGNNNNQLEKTDFQNNLIIDQSILSTGSARATATAIRENALLYGTFADAAANQQLTINANVGIRTTSPSARLHIVSTTEQFRGGYDASNYWNATTNSAGTTTFNAVGSTPKFVFSDNIELTQTVTTESVASDRTVTIVINGTTYKLLAKVV
jgi:hypothetical protein